MRERGAGKDILPSSRNYADLVARMKQDLPPATMTEAAATTVGRHRAVRADLVRAIQRAGSGGSEVAAARDAGAGPDRSGAPRDVARQTLAGLADRLLADARSACRREGIAATRWELFARVAKRIGLSQAEVARGLDRAIRRDGSAAPSAVTGRRRPRDPVAAAATTILGAREREVFLARRAARPGRRRRAAPARRRPGSLGRAGL